MNIEDQIHAIALNLAELQLEFSKLEIEKAKCIRSQLYEKASDLRMRQKELLALKKNCKDEIQMIRQDHPFSPKNVSQHVLLEELLISLDQVKIAREKTFGMINEKIDALEKTWNKIKDDFNSPKQKKVLSDLKDWQEALQRFAFREQFSLKGK